LTTSTFFAAFGVKDYGTGMESCGVIDDFVGENYGVLCADRMVLLKESSSQL